MMGPPPSRSVAKLPPRSRPVFPYPAVARYSGKGSIDEAASFIRNMPEPHTDVASWIGSAP